MADKTNYQQSNNSEVNKQNIYNNNSDGPDPKLKLRFIVWQDKRENGKN